MNKKILLVEPSFPVPRKSKNHKNFLPIGLLKLGAMHKQRGNKVKLIRGNKNKKEIAKKGKGRWYVPHKVLITSLFTYWKPYVENCVKHYKDLFKDTYLNPKIRVGGIYASLMPEDCKKIKGVDEVFRGVHPEAEKYKPAYKLIEQNPEPLDYQIVHTSRGCPRKCEFCGTWRIEPEFKTEGSIKDQLVDGKEGVVFYDNNILKNPYITDILEELIELKEEGKIKWCESQSGFDGRVLLEEPELAKKIYKAGFRYPRIAWDGQFEDKEKIKRQIEILHEGGFDYKDIFLFVLYNWEIPFGEMEKKRIKCFEWGVQISDCRFRPLDQTHDNYNPQKYAKGQSENEYYIHTERGWTDEKIREFRRNVRRQNICVRFGYDFYSPDFERMKISKEKIRKIRKKLKQLSSKEKMKDYLEKEDIIYWFPDEKSDL